MPDKNRVMIPGTAEIFPCFSFLHVDIKDPVTWKGQLGDGSKKGASFESADCFQRTRQAGITVCRKAHFDEAQRIENDQGIEHSPRKVRHFMGGESKFGLPLTP